MSGSHEDSNLGLLQLESSTLPNELTGNSHQLLLKALESCSFPLKSSPSPKFTGLEPLAPWLTAPMQRKNDLLPVGHTKI